MLDMGMWRHVKSNDHPNDRRLVGCRWVFKMKRNGVYHDGLVAIALSRIPGVDFTDNYSPAVNDVIFRVVVARMIIDNMKGEVVDIDNAFLNRSGTLDLHEDSEGYDEVINPTVDKEDCLISRRQYMDWFKQQDNFGRKLWTRCKKKVSS